MTFIILFSTPFSLGRGEQADECVGLGTAWSQLVSPVLGKGMGVRGAGQPRTKFPGVLLPWDISGVFSGHRCHGASLGYCPRGIAAVTQAVSGCA